MDNKEYENLLKKTLSNERYIHSINVANQAVFLGEIYKEDTQNLYVAGLLHDICKEIPQQEQLDLMKQGNISFEGGLTRQPKVWHGMAASVFIKNELNINNPQIINAVRYHTTARANMDMFEKIIYIADFTSAERDFPSVDYLRKLAKENIDEAVKFSLIYTMKKIIDNELCLNIDTCLAYNEYI